MANKFDNFSKHLATKQSRRGALKFLGASVIGAALATVFRREANADWYSRSPSFNGSRWYNRSPKFNSTF